MAGPIVEPLGKVVLRVIREGLDQFLTGHANADVSWRAERARLSPHVADWLDTILGLPSYREGALTQLAWSLSSPTPIDVTQRQKGGRTATADLKKILEARHISARNAFENIGKNSPELRRGNVPAWDAFLGWATSAKEAERKAAFGYLLARVSLMSRPVLPMPELDRAKLTFAHVARLFKVMLDAPSGGVHQQFIVTACLHAIIEEFGVGGPGGLRVETKNVSTSDATSGAAGDIQIMRGGRTEEAFEVTANPWQSKISAATRVTRSADLQRTHVVASAPSDDFSSIEALEADVSVLDVGAFVRTMIALMRKPAREAALVRLYDLLDRLQPDIEKTNEYVNLLRRHGLTTT
jgi:hypothetical protein